MHQVEPFADFSWARLLVILFAFLFVKAVFFPRHGRRAGALFVLVALVGTFVLYRHLQVPTAREMHVKNEVIPSATDGRLQVELRPTPAAEQVSGQDLALTLRSLLFELATEPGNSPAVSLANLQAKIVHRDGDEMAIALSDIARLRRHAPADGRRRDVIVDLSVSSPSAHALLTGTADAQGGWPPARSRRSAHALLAGTADALASYLAGENGHAPFIMESSLDSIVLRIPAAVSMQTERPASIPLETAAASDAPDAKPEAAHAVADEVAALPAEAPETEKTPMVTGTISLGTARPAWVGDASRQQDGGYAIVVSAGPYVTTDECQRHLDEQLQQRVRTFMTELLGPQGARVQPSVPEIRGWENPSQRWAEVIQNPEFGPMYNMYARVIIPPDKQSMLKERLKQMLIQDRLGFTGAGACLFLLALGTVFGYLRLDTATRGYYRGRLGLAAALVMVAILFGGVAFLRYAFTNFAL